MIAVEHTPDLHKPSRRDGCWPSAIAVQNFCCFWAGYTAGPSVAAAPVGMSALCLPAVSHTKPEHIRVIPLW